MALGLIAIQVVFGGFIDLVGDSGGAAWVSVFHLLLALLVLGHLLPVTLIAFRTVQPAWESRRFAYKTGFVRLSIMALASLLVLYVSGASLAALHGSGVCQGWPLCGGDIFPQGTAGRVALVHRVMTAWAGALVAVLVIQAWRYRRNSTLVLVASTAAGVLFSAQALLGSRLVEGYSPSMQVLHQTSATALWASLVILVAELGLTERNTVGETKACQRVKGLRGQLYDLLMLTKPVVVALLLVTTLSGMVIGASSWPSFRLAFWTLLGGFLAAGGSGAINQYIDRYDDLKMQRTKKRPIPAGRLTPAEGLAFGVAACLAAFYLLVAYVNLLAALLALAGMIYYVLLYSLILKKSTVQNIVVGGGAGAIPPLVGWAAATGSLDIPALFLFAVIFMWTPPHFWALALVRLKDYTRAGIPMLPVVRGERETRWQILLYTGELVALTLLLPLFGLGGSFYLVSAGILGGFLLVSAWKVWKLGGNKAAWKMYRNSSMYLACLFAALVVDVLV